MPSIFISYRRKDTQFQAHFIYKTLREHFGEESVFIDVDDIPPGNLVLVVRADLDTQRAAGEHEKPKQVDPVVGILAAAFSAFIPETRYWWGLAPRDCNQRRVDRQTAPSRRRNELRHCLSGRECPPGTAKGPSDRCASPFFDGA